jgi:site-specific recombinase XerD
MVYRETELSGLGDPVSAQSRIRRPTEVPTTAEIERLLRAFNTRAPTGVRNMALVVVLWRSGLRIAESLALLPKDLDSTRGTLQVLGGRGRSGEW